MVRRASRVRLVLGAMTAIVVIAAGCGGSDDVGSPPARRGPELSEVRTTEQLAEAIRAYDGPYTVHVTSHRGSGSTSVLHFDGTNMSMDFGEGYETRATTDGWCYQSVGSGWVAEQTVNDVDFTFERYVGLSSVIGGAPWTDVYSVDDATSTVGDELVITRVDTPSSGDVDRFVLRIDDGELTRLDAFVDDEHYSTERYFWDR